MGSPAKNQLLIFLSHAPQHAKDLVRVFIHMNPDPTQGTVNFIFRMLTHTTSIKENHISISGLSCKLVPLFFQSTNNNFAIQNIHLAADGFDEKFLSHGYV